MSFPCLICGSGIATGRATSYGNSNGRSLYLRTGKGVETWAVICNQCLRMFDEMPIDGRSLWAHKLAVHTWNTVFPNNRRTSGGVEA